MKNPKKIPSLFVFAVLFAILFSMFSCSSANDPSPEPKPANDLIQTSWEMRYPDPADLFSGKSSLYQKLTFVTDQQVRHDYLDNDKKVISSKVLNYQRNDKLIIDFEASKMDAVVSSKMLTFKHPLGTDIYYKI